MSMPNLQRRGFLKGFVKAGALVSVVGGYQTAFAKLCGVETSKQSLGPFYPQSNNLFDQNNDLTTRDGRNFATGQVIFVTGKILSEKDCKPVAGALVEIWQAANSGRYNHSQDSSGLSLDKHFGYWGEVLTDEQGQYAFKTIVPGYYPAGAHDDGTDWYRPPHIHYKVSAMRFQELVTQLYFEPKSFSGEPLQEKIKLLNQLDPILQGAKNSKELVRPFEKVNIGQTISYIKKDSAGKIIAQPSMVPKGSEVILNFDISIRSV